MLNLRRKGILLLAIVAVVTILFIITMLIMRTQDNAAKLAVKIAIAPHNARVIIDGSESKAGTIHLTPGQHTFVVEKEGFETQKQVETINEPSTLIFALEAVSEEAKQYERENPEQYLEIEGIAGELTAQEGEKFREKNPIVNNLPLRSVLYDINYRRANNDPNRAVIEISATTAENRSFAIERIRSWGVNPTDYEIVFLDLPRNTLLEQQ